jgi:phosphatidate phosphatase PAH1
MQSVWNSDILVKENNSTAWFCVLKTSKKIHNISITKAEIGEEEIAKDLLACVKFLPVRACSFHRYFQLVFQVSEAEQINENQRNTRISILGSSTENLHKDLVGKYFETMSYCFRDKFCVTPPQHWVKQIPLQNRENILTLWVEGPNRENHKLSLHIWKVSSKTKLVISDVDGTVTKMEYGSKAFHTNVRAIYKEIAKDMDILFVYLTVRPFKRTERIRKLLYENCLTEQFPRGPILTVPYETIDSIEGFSIGRATQLKMIHAVELFELNVPIYAAFGNRKADQNVYDTLNVPKTRQVLIIFGGCPVIQGKRMTFRDLQNVLGSGHFEDDGNWMSKALWWIFVVENKVDRILGMSYASTMTLLYNFVTKCRLKRNIKML